MDSKLTRFAQIMIYLGVRTTFGGYYWLDIVKLFLWWIIYYQPYQTLSEQHGIPKSTWHECVIWTLTLV